MRNPTLPMLLLGWPNAAAWIPSARVPLRSPFWVRSSVQPSADSRYDTYDDSYISNYYDAVLQYNERVTSEARNEQLDSSYELQDYRDYRDVFTIAQALEENQILLNSDLAPYSCYENEGYSSSSSGGWDTVATPSEQCAEAQDSFGSEDDSSATPEIPPEQLIEKEVQEYYGNKADSSDEEQLGSEVQEYFGREVDSSEKIGRLNRELQEYYGSEGGSSDTSGGYASFADVTPRADDSVTTEPSNREWSISTKAYDAASQYIAPQLVSDVTEAVLVAPQSNQPGIEVDSSKLIVPESNQRPPTAKPKRRFSLSHFRTRKATTSNRSNKLPRHVDPWKLVDSSTFWKKHAKPSLEAAEKSLNDDTACTLALGTNIRIGPIYSEYTTMVTADGLQQRGTLQAVVKGSIREGIVELSATTQQGLEHIKVAIVDMDGQYFLRDVPLPGVTASEANSASSNTIQVVDLAQEDQSETDYTKNHAEEDQANRWPENWCNTDGADVAPAAFYPSQAIDWPKDWAEPM